MNKKKILFLFLLAIVSAFVLVILFGGYVSARLANVPLLRNLRFAGFQAPVIITQREEVRVSDTEDYLDAITRSKSKLSSVVSMVNGEVLVLGSAVNIAGDGVFLTTQQTMAGTSSKFVLLNDGKTVPITGSIADPVSNLVFLLAASDNIPVIDFAVSKSLLPGQKVLFLSSSVLDHASQFYPSFIASSQQEVLNKRFSSDRPARTFNTSSVIPLVAGQAVLTLDGKLAGIWDGSTIVSSDIARRATTLYFSGRTGIARPSFGFEYKMIIGAESALLQLPKGARVELVVRASAAATAGLREGDIITRVDTTTVDEQNMLEELLERYEPGDQVRLTVQRGAESLEIILIPVGIR